MLTQVADGVWVRQSDWVWTNSTVVRTDDGLVVVDPGISAAELDALADGIDAIGVGVIAGFCTHPHWDHLLWHPRLGDVPRYATADGARFAAQTLPQQREGAVRDAEGVALEGLGLVTALPENDGPVPGRLIEHEAHAVGHAAVWLADRGVLLAGDMLSDVLLPIFDPAGRHPDQLGAYETALGRLEAVIDDVEVVVCGHGTVGDGAAARARLAADTAYVDALRRGVAPADARLDAAPWLAGIHENNLRQLDGRRATRAERPRG